LLLAERCYDAQARADRLEILLRDERLARKRAEEELELLKAKPPPQVQKKSKSRVNFNARPWLFQYKTQSLEGVEDEDGVPSQASSGGDMKQKGVAVGGVGVVLQYFPLLCDTTHFNIC
jgi:hypothetical protein